MSGYRAKRRKNYSRRAREQAKGWKSGKGFLFAGPQPPQIEEGESINQPEPEKKEDPT